MKAGSLHVYPAAKLERNINRLRRSGDREVGDKSLVAIPHTRIRQPLDSAHRIRASDARLRRPLERGVRRWITNQHDRRDVQESKSPKG